LLVAGGGGLWLKLERDARAADRAQALQALEADLRQVNDLWKNGKYAEARLQLERTDARMEATGRKDLRARVQRARDDLEMVARLEAIRLDRASVRDSDFDNAGSDKAYRKAFADYGLDLGALAVDEAARRILESAIQGPLVAALDDWANVMTRLDDWANVKRGEARQRLLVIARQADPDAWRARLREAVERGDEQALQEMAGEKQTADLPPTTLVLLRDALSWKGAVKEAVGVLEAGYRRHPSAFWLNHQLALSLTKTKPTRLAEAVGYYRAAVALRPDSPGVHINLGLALHDQGKPAAAAAEYREAIRLKKDYPEAHCNLGNVLLDLKHPEEAIEEYRKALEIDPKLAKAHNGLGAVLCDDQGKPAEAAAEYREAIRLKKDYPKAHYNLGNVLFDQGKLPAAEAEYREAIRLKKDYPEAHCNLGMVLKNQGRFVDALQWLKRGHELGSKVPGWPNPSAQWVRMCEHLLELDRKLAAILRGETKPAHAAESLELANLCQQHYKRFYATAARFYADAFAADPKLAADKGQQHRYNAACSAALAAAGQGEDARSLPDKDAQRLRQQALDWLRADLAAYAKLAERDEPAAKQTVRQKMVHWQQNADLASVRDRDALDRLPEAERMAWYQLWDDVTGLLKKVTAAAPAPPNPAAIQPYKIETRPFGEVKIFGKGGKGYWFNRVAFTADGKSALVTGGGVIRYDLESGREVYDALEVPFARNCLALSKDRTLFLTGHQDDKLVRLGEVKTGKVVRTFEGHTAGVHAVALSSDGERAVSGGEDGTLRLRDVKTGKELRQFKEITDRVFSAAFAPDGRHVASGHYGPRTSYLVRLWNTDTGKEVRTFKGHTGDVTAVAFLPDGRSLLSASFDGTLRLWEVESGKELWTMKHEGGSATPRCRRTASGRCRPVGVIRRCACGT
jgi:Tfp pilus assembly protein PilF